VVARYLLNGGRGDLNGEGGEAPCPIGDKIKKIKKQKKTKKTTIK
jgi:hypothetical protein